MPTKLSNQCYRQAGDQPCLGTRRRLACRSMRLLDRYLLRELLIPLGYCLAGFLLLSTVSDMFASLGDLQDKQMLASDILQYYLVRSPEMLVLILPIALLLALLYTLTNHARHHEITAIRAAGISLWRLAIPYFAVGFVCALALFALNEYFVPDSADIAEQIKYRRSGQPAPLASTRNVRNLGFNNDRDGRIWQIARYDAETGNMTDPKVFCKQPDGSWILLQAERAARTGEVWTFYNVREYRETATNALLIPVLQTNVLRLPQFTETPEQIKSEIRIAGTITLRLAKRADIPISEILNYLRLHPNVSKTDGWWLYTKLQGRLAAPWTCLVVVLIALPFGAASGRRNVFVGVASSILICFVYFVLQQFSLAFGTGGYVPPWVAAWLPNLAFGLVGLWLTARVR